MSNNEKMELVPRLMIQLLSVNAGLPIGSDVDHAAVQLLSLARIGQAGLLSGCR